MNRFPIFAFITLIALSIWWLTVANHRHESDDISSKPDASQQRLPSPVKAPRPKPFPEEITLLPVAKSSHLLNSSEQAAEEDLSMIQSMLRFHRQALGGNPVGLNDEITASLTGRNAKGAASLPKNHPAISERGELLDRWGTPYRFHAYSEKLMELRSAGPDRKFNTSDDLKLLE